MIPFSCIFFNVMFDLGCSEDNVTDPHTAQRLLSAIAARQGHHATTWLHPASTSVYDQPTIPIPHIQQPQLRA